MTPSLKKASYETFSTNSYNFISFRLLPRSPRRAEPGQSEQGRSCGLSTEPYRNRSQKSRSHRQVPKGKRSIQKCQRPRWSQWYRAQVGKKEQEVFVTLKGHCQR